MDCKQNIRQLCRIDGYAYGEIGDRKFSRVDDARVSGFSGVLSGIEEDIEVCVIDFSELSVAAEEGEIDEGGFEFVILGEIEWDDGYADDDMLHGLGDDIDGHADGFGFCGEARAVENDPAIDGEGCDFAG